MSSGWKPKHVWTLGLLLVALSLSGAWGLLDARLGMQTGLRYDVYLPGAALDDMSAASGTVALPALNGPGVGRRDASKLTRGLGRRTIRWSGLWYVPTSGVYEIFVAASGQLSVRIDGQRVARNRGTWGAPTSGTVELGQGFHRLLVTLRRTDDRPRMAVHWAPEGGAPRPFDRNRLFPLTADLDRHAWFLRLVTLWRVSLACWAMTLLLIGASITPAALRKGGLAGAFFLTRVRKTSDALTVVAAVGCGVLVTTTFFQHEIRRLFPPRWGEFLNLLGEGNLAAWWSGVLLLLAAFYAVAAATDTVADGRARGAALAELRPSARLGWSCIALVVTALSADEIASLHEFMDGVIGWGTWWSLLPFALVLLGLVAVGLCGLWVTESLRGTTMGLVAGFAVLATIPPLLEVTEHANYWGIGSRWSDAGNVRAVAEESAELCGMLILLHTCAWGRIRLHGPRRGSWKRDFGPAPVALRRPVLLAGLPLAAVVAVLSRLLPAEMNPAAWFAMATFFLAAIIAIGSDTGGKANRALAVMAVVGSVSGVSSLPGGLAWLGVSVLLAATWLYVRHERADAPGWWLPSSALALGLFVAIGEPPERSTAAVLVPLGLGLLTLALTLAARTHVSSGEDADHAERARNSRGRGISYASRSQSRANRANVIRS